jgi:hypothetical protein
MWKHGDDDNDDTEWGSLRVHPQIILCPRKGFLVPL